MLPNAYGPHNTLLDNCFVYTAFSALDPLTQDKVSRLTGSVTELRTSRSGPAGLGAGRSSVSRSETERPLLEPGEVRSLPDDVQLTFVAGFRPLRTRKVRYDAREPFRSRAAFPPPDQAARLDTPGAPPHPWAGRRALGADRNARLPLFKEAGRVIARGLQRSLPADPEDRLLRLERALRDHMRAMARDMQIVQELQLENARALFHRLPDSLEDEDPTVLASVECRVERLLDAVAAHIVAGGTPAKARARQAESEVETPVPQEPRTFAAPGRR